MQPYPVDWKTRGWFDALVPEDNFLNGLALTNLALHEWLGLLAYRLTGRIGELFPAPELSPARPALRDELQSSSTSVRKSPSTSLGMLCLAAISSLRSRGNNRR